MRRLMFSVVLMVGMMGCKQPAPQKKITELDIIEKQQEIILMHTEILKQHQAILLQNSEMLKALAQKCAQ